MGASMTDTRSPTITWDGKTWHASLPVDDGQTIDARWELSVTYVIRIREKGPGPWGPGFETPLATCTFVDLEPGVEYEVEIRPKTADGEGDPLPMTVNTNETGDKGNVIPFPKR